MSLISYFHILVLVTTFNLITVGSVAANEVLGAEADFETFARECDSAVAPDAYGALGDKLDRLLVDYPENPALREMAFRYLTLLKKGDPKLHLEAAEKYMKSNHPGVARVAREAKATADYIAAIHAAGDVKFTAVDGRPVDTAQLRGKLVLLDFWATWCGPCKEGLPDVINTYEKYHSRGLEIIGIALEHAGIQPADSTEVQAAKLAKARASLLDFTKEHGMPWPQYCDGRGVATELARQYRVTAIPQMFLLGPTGKLIWAGHGEGLQSAVRRALDQYRAP